MFYQIAYLRIEIEMLLFFCDTKEDLECLQGAQLGFQPKTVAYTYTISTMKTIEDNENIVHSCTIFLYYLDGEI